MTESGNARYQRIRRAAQSGISASVDDTRWLCERLAAYDKDLELAQADVELLVSVMKTRREKLRLDGGGE